MTTSRALLWVPLIASTALVQANEAADPRQLVEARQAEWNAAFNRGDVEGLAAAYAEDAVVMPPNDTTLRHPEQIRAFWSEVLASGLREHHVDIMDVRVEGDTIYETGVWSAAAQSGDGSRQVYGGNVVTVYQRQADGSWKARLHSWN